MTEAASYILAKFLYVIVGGITMLLLMTIGCSLFGKMCSFNISDELGKGNIAVGLMVMGLFIGIGIALGMVIGFGL